MAPMTNLVTLWKNCLHRLRRDTFNLGTTGSYLHHCSTQSLAVGGDSAVEGLKFRRTDTEYVRGVEVVKEEMTKDNAKPAAGTDSIFSSAGLDRVCGAYLLGMCRTNDV